MSDHTSSSSERGSAASPSPEGLEKAPVEVTLVDRENFTTFQPLLYQVATSGLNAADVAHPIRGLFHRQRNLHVLRGEVTGVDWERGVVHLRDERDVPFDHLVVAVGAVATWFGVPGAEQHATPLYTLDDAVRVRNHVLGRFEAADADPELIEAGELNFVVVGGGPTGVETAGALAELFSVVFRRDYPTLGVGRARVVLVETRDALLGPFHRSSQRAALDTLRARQVEVRLDETVAEVTRDHVRFASGEVLPTRTVVWAAGVTANPLAAELGLPTTRSGRIAVGADLRVEGHEDVWALGDVAAAPDHHGGALPQLAPVAMQSGAHVARQIVRAIEGRPTQPFRFRDKGTMATIGRRSAVAELPGRIRLRGTLGVARLARTPPAVPRRPAQPAVGAAQLGLGLPDLGSGAADHLRRPPPRHVGPPRQLRRPGGRGPRTIAGRQLGLRPMADDQTADPAAIDATIDAYLASFGAADPDAYVGAFAADGWLEDPVGSPRRVGHDAIREFWTESRSLADAIDLVALGFRVVVGNEAVLTLQARPVVGGQTYALDIVDHMTFDADGRIALAAGVLRPDHDGPARGLTPERSDAAGDAVDRDLDGHAVGPLARLPVALGVATHRLGDAAGVVGHGRRALERQPPAPVDLADDRPVRRPPTRPLGGRRGGSAPCATGRT